MSKKKIHVAHITVGRVRLKVPHGRGDPEALDAVADAFRAIPGIESVETNPVTGCVVLNYDPDRHDEFNRHFVRGSPQVEGWCGQPPRADLEKFADSVQSEAEFLAEHSAGARAFVEFCKRLDRQIKVASDNNLDLKLVLAGGVVAATILKMGVTASTPVWVTLLLFGANHFVELHAQSAKRAQDICWAEIAKEH
jgi:hypothetical protein